MSRSRRAGGSVKPRVGRADAPGERASTHRETERRDQLRFLVGSRGPRKGQTKAASSIGKPCAPPSPRALRLSAASQQRKPQNRTSHEPARLRPRDGRVAADRRGAGGEHLRRCGVDRQPRAASRRRDAQTRWSERRRHPLVRPGARRLGGFPAPLGANDTLDVTMTWTGQELAFGAIPCATTGRRRCPPPSTRPPACGARCRPGPLSARMRPAAEWTVTESSSWLADRRPSAQDHRLLLPWRTSIRQPADGESFRLPRPRSRACNPLSPGPVTA